MRVGAHVEAFNGAGGRDLAPANRHNRNELIRVSCNADITPERACREFRVICQKAWIKNPANADQKGRAERQAFESSAHPKMHKQNRAARSEPLLFRPA